MILEIGLLIALIITGVMWLFFRKSGNGFLKEVASLFPLILVVFSIRSFAFEPFRIPSGSMLPNLYLGDFIVVKKFSYGIKLPIINKKIIETGEPERGDVIVFRYPNDPQIYYIKRLVGLPGDEVLLEEHKVSVNGQELKVVDNGNFDAAEGGEVNSYINAQFIENHGDNKYKILRSNSDRFLSAVNSSVAKFTVPEGQYFMMGDNRDHSSDSRFWGFVPEDKIIGKASMIWMSFYNWQFRFDRIGESLE